MEKKIRKEDYIFPNNSISIRSCELADAIKKNDINKIQEELADLVFCATQISNFFNINLNEIIESKYVKQKPEQVSRKWPEPINE